MDGNVSAQLLVLFCDSAEPGFSPYDFASWFLGTHVAPLQTARIVSRASIYERATSLTRDDLPQYMAIYDPATTLDQAFDRIWLELGGETCANAAVVRQFGGLERIGRWVTQTHGHCEGVLVGITDCNDLAQEPDFHRWYDDVHAADVIKSQQYWSRQRYRRSGQGTLDSQYYAFYESGQPEPMAAKRYMAWPERNPEMHPAVVLKHVWTYNRLLPQLPS